MKVVLFCGGLGLRLREAGGDIPKPMVPIGYRPILWHVMKYYAHFGHKDFILCLGHRADVIKKYFLDYEEAISNDFVLSGGGRQVDLMHTDISDWRITFVDTGIGASVGERLWAVRDYVSGEDLFLANYADGLTDLRLPEFVEGARRDGAIATFLGVRPNLSYHAVSVRDGGLVNDIRGIADTGLRVNGGYFVFRPAIFDYMRPGEELVVEPFHRLIQAGQLRAHLHDGFFTSMDTFKDKQYLEDLYDKGNAPWEVWRATSTPKGA